LITGSVLLFYGADWIVKGGSQLAKYFGLSTIVIGLTVVAFGTSLPELVVSLTAALEGSPTIAVGNVVGSNIANVGLVLGLSSLVFPITMKFAQIKIDLGIYMIVCLLFTYFCMDGEIIRMEGLILFACIIAYTWFAIIHSPKNKDPEIGQINQNVPLSKSLLLVMFGIIFLSFGANIFITGAMDIARYFGVSEIVIGMTIVALGTSLPELATSVIAAFRKESAISIGNIIGSNLFNLLSVIGLVSVISPLESPVEIIHFEIPYMVVYGFILIPIGLMPQPIHRGTAILLLLGYGVFIFQMF
jgi:cation:H+ antiporter